MVVQSIQVNHNNTKSQPSLKQKKVVKPYLDANEKILTNRNVKPLPGQGHLIHDNPVSSVKYFFKDIAYDLKALRDGYQGNANDHQLGRLNDVGLRLGGSGIATYLATQTTNPKARLMEFVGLGAFLASMSIFPKIAINKPARIMHGFDIDKQYIDDQGRKKSVFQDSNYIPFDLYRGEYKSEDLDVIADRMGIPRDTENRHDFVKEQMRKIATQNNTLWMLTAGFATPALAGLTCCALEQPISSGLAQARNTKYNKQISEVLRITQEMGADVASLKENSLSKDVSKVLSKYLKDGVLPPEEFEHVTKLITQDLDVYTSQNLVAELREIFETAAGEGDRFALFNKENMQETLNVSRKGIKANKNILNKIVPTAEELESVISQVKKDADFSKDVRVNFADLGEIKKALGKLIDKKIEAETDETLKEFLTELKISYLNKFSKNVKTQKSFAVNESVIDKVTKLSMVIGDYKKNQSVIEKCKHFKLAHAPETIIANYSGKFERALLNELNFTQDELKRIRDSADFAREILDRRLTEIASDEVQYNRIIKKLTKVISDMDTALHGGAESESVLRRLVVAIENNANNTAKRLSSLGGFDGTINSLVNDKIDNLKVKFDNEYNFRDLLEGTIKNSRGGNHVEQISGVGSYKHLQIANVAERYQGSTNSFLRILEALDVYKRALNPSEYAPEMALRSKGDKYVEDLIKVGKQTILDATCADHMTKLNTINNGERYRDIIKSLFRIEYTGSSNLAQGVLNDATEKAVEDNESLKAVLAKLKRYIGRFYEIVPNNTNDTLKDKTHIIDRYALGKYDKSCRTNKSIFDLVAQEPTELLRGAADRRYGTRKWVGIIGGITAAVFGVTYLAQLGFGKLNRPRKEGKQGENVSSK